MGIKERKASRQSLESHETQDFKTAHGIWGEIKKILPVMISPADDITDQFAWAGAWENIDLAAETSSSARWAILSFIIEKGSDFLLPIYIGPYGTTDDANRTIELGGPTPASTNYYFGGVFWIPMDGFQRFAIKTRAGATTKYVYLLGYCG